YGGVIVCLDSPGVRGIISDIYRPITTYGISSQADYRAEDIQFINNTTTYLAYYHHKKLGQINLNVPGQYNVLNSLAAIGVGMEMEIPFNIIKKGLIEYEGVRRRFEIKGIVNDIMVVDDYAHHPTEVTATLDAARSGWNRRIIAVFQPHLFTRTRDFYRDFAEAFLNSDILIVTDIYPAREEKIKGIDGNLVAKTAKEIGHRHVHYIPNLDDLIKNIEEITQPGDMVIGIGAGTIWRYIEKYFNYLEDNCKDN
ncbi:MAG: UDP-N-acetylmuramate--L-alanine ligase, partial [Candidatus Marinimicrobia bacterium]|nr:UDP-N-acetylmuramate--L-alanine ligase [Candidatus Neomarinimicrobiota bacterium]